MIRRTAFFEGKIKSGCEAEFTKLLEGTLIPLWKTFPGAQDVRIFQPADSDASAPDYLFVLVTTYPDRETMVAALASTAREKTRHPSELLKSMFDGRVFHITFDDRDLSVDL